MSRANRCEVFAADDSKTHIIHIELYNKIVRGQEDIFSKLLKKPHWAKAKIHREVSTDMRYCFLSIPVKSITNGTMDLMNGRVLQPESKMVYHVSFKKNIHLEKIFENQQ